MNANVIKPYGEDEDEDQSLDEILKMLGGEVDDFAGKQLPDPDGGRFEAGPKAGGVEVHISVSPHAQPGKKEGPEEEENEGGIGEGSETKGEMDEEHDPIAHILGMCGGGCAY